MIIKLLLIIISIINYSSSIRNNKLEVYDLNSKGPLKIVIHSGLGSRSHIKPILEISTLLQKRGHHIIYAASEDCLPYLNGYNITGFNLGPSMFLNNSNVINSKKDKKRVQSSQNSNQHPTKIVMDRLAPYLILYYQTYFSALKQFLIKQEPNLLVCDFFSTACIDLAKSLQIPLITTFQTTDIPNIIYQPYITTGFKHQSTYITDMNLLQRFYTILIDPLLSRYYITSYLNQINQLREQRNIPTTFQLFGDINYGLKIANTFTGFEPALPLEPTLHQIGPILSKNYEVLNHEVKQFLTKNQRTIYIAFGSGGILDSKLLKVLLEGLIHAIDLKIIDSVIWGLGKRLKLENFPKEILNKYGNLIPIKSLIHSNSSYQFKIMEWAPQQALLNNNQILLFISHCGLESSFEGIYSGTPILCIPLYGDQIRNAYKIQDNKIGSLLDSTKITTEELIYSIKKLIKDKSFQFLHNSIKMQTIIHHNQQKIHSTIHLFEQHAYLAMTCRKNFPLNSSLNLPPCELAHLIPKSYELGFIKSNAIDVVGFALLILLVNIYLLSWFLVRLISFLLNLRNASKLKYKPI